MNIFLSISAEFALFSRSVAYTLYRNFLYIYNSMSDNILNIQGSLWYQICASHVSLQQWRLSTQQDYGEKFRRDFINHCPVSNSEIFLRLYRTSIRAVPSAGANQALQFMHFFYFSWKYL